MDAVLISFFYGRNKIGDGTDLSGKSVDRKENKQSICPTQENSVFMSQPS